MRSTADGATERDHQESAARQWEKLGKRQKAVAAAAAVEAGPQLPDPIAYLWYWFLEIIVGLDGGGFGPPVISWSSLKAWSELTRNDPEPWEVATLIRLGALRASIIGEDIKKKAKQK